MTAEQPARQFDVDEARTQLARLVKLVEAGEEIVISRAGTLVARLVPVADEVRPRPRVRGLWRGRVVIHDDFDDLPPELGAAFDGEDGPSAPG